METRRRAPGDKSVKSENIQTAQPENKLPADVLEEAKELCLGAEVLPEGHVGLARKIMEARKEGRPLRAKLGIDPTSTDLHLGHAVVFRKLRQFQDFGHQVVIIIGGFTAQIGDPSGRNATRPPLTAEQVAVNAETYLAQMGVLLDLEKVELTNNADWLTPLTFKEIIKLASLVTANQLLAKEGFGERLDKQLPVSFHELFYPLLQGYDSVAIRADVELGGTDQRFNILQGRELQPSYGLKPQLAMLLPLLEGTDGVKKMSKSYDNYIALKDSPTDMFGKSMRIPDELIIKYFQLTTTLTGKEIEEIKQKLESGGNPKEAKEELACQLVRQYHGAEAAEHALAEWQRVHSQKQIPEDIPLCELDSVSASVTHCLTVSGLVPSSSEAKRKIKEGAVKLDGDRITDPNYQVELNSGAGRVLQVGNRRFVRLKLPG